MFVKQTKRSKRNEAKRSETKRNEANEMKWNYSTYYCIADLRSGRSVPCGPLFPGKGLCSLLALLLLTLLLSLCGFCCCCCYCCCFCLSLFSLSNKSALITHVFLNQPSVERLCTTGTHFRHAARCCCSGVLARWQFFLCYCQQEAKINLNLLYLVSTSITEKKVQEEEVDEEACEILELQNSTNA